VPTCLGYDPRSHRGNRPPRWHEFPTGGSYFRFEPRHMNGPCFPCHVSRPTRSNGDVQKIIKNSSRRMVKCCIPMISVTNPSIEPSVFSHHI
jgi:hypothetical protein